MYKEFGKPKDWKRVISTAVFLIGCFSLPVSVLFIYLAVQIDELNFYAYTFICCSFVIYFPATHLINLYSFPSVIIDDNFLVVTTSFQKRRVYTLNKITNVHKFFSAIFFLHNNLPVLIKIESSNIKEDTAELINLLISTKI